MLARYAAQSDESSAITLSLARSIKASFPRVKTSEDRALAMWLDPRFKDDCYTATAEEKLACTLLTKAAEGTVEVVHCEPSSESIALAQIASKILLCGGPLQALLQMVLRGLVLPSKTMLRAT